MPTWFLAPIAGLKLPTQATQAGGIDSLESIPGLLKRLQIRAQVSLLMHIYSYGTTVQNWAYVIYNVYECYFNMF